MLGFVIMKTCPFPVKFRSSLQMDWSRVLRLINVERHLRLADDDVPTSQVSGCTGFYYILKQSNLKTDLKRYRAQSKDLALLGISLLYGFKPQNYCSY